MRDKLSDVILKIINNSNEPLETKEVVGLATQLSKDATRAKIFYRLTVLRAEGEIKGKFIGSGKGVWIWWRKDAFEGWMK